MSIKEFPRLITEILRGTYRHQKLKALRSASERTNSTAKDDFCILAKPKVRGIPHAAILSQMAVIVVLLKRITRFITKVTIALRKQLLTNKAPPHPHFIPGPKMPNFINNLIQRE
jgi:hypothetical protein